jgi:hypothetical protein
VATEPPDLDETEEEDGPEDEFLDECGDPRLAFELPGDAGYLVVGGVDGWAGLVVYGVTGPEDVRVRLERFGSRLAVTGVAILGRGALTAADLRSVPMVRLQALLDHPRWAVAIADAMWHARGQYVDLSPSGMDPDRVDFGDPVAPPPALYVIDGAHAAHKPDGFYLAVAAAWTSALAHGHKNPASVLAEFNDVPLTTIHRWVRVARERRLLAPSTRTSGHSDS